MKNDEYIFANFWLIVNDPDYTYKRHDNAILLFFINHGQIIKYMYYDPNKYKTWCLPQYEHKVVFHEPGYLACMIHLYHAVTAVDNKQPLGGKLGIEAIK